MIYKGLPCIIKNSENTIYKFYLDSSDNLIVENYNEFNIKNNIRLVYKQFILDYSVDIDNTDKIHITFVTKDGILKYSTLDFPNIEKIISRVPSKDYKINYVTIKNISSDIHIFYMVQNKYNINKWTINHSFLYNNAWNSKKLGEISFIKNSLPYTIDSYKNNIYIFYLTNTSNRYCIQKFNIPFSLWSTIENDITLINCRNAELFINGLGIGVICYNSYINRTINTFLKFKDFNVNSSIWSDDLLVRNNSFDPSLPSILYNNDALFLFWKENDTLFLAKSFYETTSLGEKKVIPYKDIITSCKYITNENLRYTNKSNFLFLINTTSPYTILENSDVKDFLKVNSKKIEQKFNPLNGPLKETLKIIAQNSSLSNKSTYDSEDDCNADKIKNIEELNNSINQSKEFMDLKYNEIDHVQATLNLRKTEIEQFKNALSIKETEIEQFKNIISSKEDEIDQFRNTISLKEIEIEQLKNSFSLKQSEIEQFKGNLSLKDAEIEQLKNSLNSKEIEIQNLNSTYSSFKNLVDEKDSLIQELYCKIQELKNENTKNFQVKKKKSFINLFKKDQ